MAEATERIADLLSRHGYDPRPNRLFCPLPDHNDRRPGSVRVFVGRDRKERLWCFSCNAGEDYWGLQELFGERVRKLPPVRRLRRKERIRQRRNESLLPSRPRIVEEVTLAQMLARQFREMNQAEQLAYVYDNQRLLRETGSPGFILQLADRMSNA